MLLVRLDDAHGLAEPRLQDVGAGDVLRVLAARVRLEHGGQQALERAVVAVGDLGQGFFGEEGLGLDSIDALELGMAVKKRFGVNLSGTTEENRSRFASVKTLADYIRTQKPEA